MMKYTRYTRIGSIYILSKNMTDIRTYVLSNDFEIYDYYKK